MTLTEVLEYSNLMFSGLFVIEMAMKIIAEGPFGYIRSIYNLFDGFIVVLRCAVRHGFYHSVVSSSVCMLIVFFGREIVIQDIGLMLSQFIFL